MEHGEVRSLKAEKLAKIILVRGIGLLRQLMLGFHSSAGMPILHIPKDGVDRPCKS